MVDVSLASLLLDHPFADGAGLLHTIDRTVSAGEARLAARQVAGDLQAAGVEPGHAVAVRLPNGPEAVLAMVAVWIAGGVFIPVNPRAPQAEVDHAIEATAPVAIVDGDGVRPLRAGGPRRYEAGVAFATWTSGTTGRPKAILHTHEGYLELLDRVLAPLRARPADPSRPPSPNLIPVSLALNAGIYNALFGLRAGAPLVIMDRFETAAFAELVRRFAIRSTVLPPAAIAMLNDDDAVTDLGPLRYVRSITAPLSPLQARRFRARFGAFVLNGYGQAEIGEVIGWTAADAKEHPEKVGAAGRPHAGVEVRVVGDDGAEVGVDEIGSLRVRPPSMAVGYATGEALDDRVDAGGFVDTGDLGRVDADGFVWIEGRAGDVINRGGNKVFPDQVEEVLRLSRAVADVAVAGVPDDRLGEVPVAFVVPAAGAGVDEAELEALCREHLVAYKVPVAFRRIDAVPRTEVGKVQRAALAARYVTR